MDSEDDELKHAAESQRLAQLVANFVRAHADKGMESEKERV